MYKFWQNNIGHVIYIPVFNILILKPLANSQELISVCVFPSGSCAAVSVLPGSDRHCHVPAQQQQPLPQLPSKSSAWVPVQRPHGVSVHWWPSAVSLHKGCKPHHTIKYVFFPPIAVISWVRSVICLTECVCGCSGAADGGVQHRCSGVEAELVWHVWTGPKQCAHERIFSPGDHISTYTSVSSSGSHFH